MAVPWIRKFRRRGAACGCSGTGADFSRDGVGHLSALQSWRTGIVGIGLAGGGAACVPCCCVAGVSAQASGTLSSLGRPKWQSPARRCPFSQYTFTAVM